MGLGRSICTLFRAEIPDLGRLTTASRDLSHWGVVSSPSEQSLTCMYLPQVIMRSKSSSALLPLRRHRHLARQVPVWQLGALCSGQLLKAASTSGNTTTTFM